MLDPFDFNGDGKVDDWERAAEAAFLYEITHNNNDSRKQVYVTRKRRKSHDPDIVIPIVAASFSVLAVLAFIAGAWVLGAFTVAFVVADEIAWKKP